jgi:hypothetical protein
VQQKSPPPESSTPSTNTRQAAFWKQADAKALASVSNTNVEHEEETDDEDDKGWENSDEHSDEYTNTDVEDGETSDDEDSEAEEVVPKQKKQKKAAALKKVVIKGGCLKGCTMARRANTYKYYFVGQDADKATEKLPGLKVSEPRFADGRAHGAPTQAKELLLASTSGLECMHCSIKGGSLHQGGYIMTTSLFHIDGLCVQHTLNKYRQRASPVAGVVQSELEQGQAQILCAMCHGNKNQGTQHSDAIKAGNKRRHGY